MRRKRLRKRRSYRRLVYLALFLLMAVGVGIWASYGAAPTGTAEDGMAAGPVKKIMVVGIDPRENDAGRGDTLFLAMVDTKEKRGAILSIPPDTRAAIEGKGYDKINHTYALGGEVLTQQTVEELLGTPMDYYLIADLQTVAWAVDAIGGVDIDVEKRMYYEDPWEENGGLIIDLYPGRQHLDGARAMAYVRYRDDEGDIGRLGRQQKFLQAVLTKASSAEVIPRLPEVVEDMRKFLQTNMPLHDMVEMAQLLPTIREQGLTAEVLPGRPGRWEGNGYWLPNIEAARELLARQMGVAFTPAMKTAAEDLSKQYQASLPQGLADVEGDGRGLFTASSDRCAHRPHRGPRKWRRHAHLSRRMFRCGCLMRAASPEPPLPSPKNCRRRALRWCPWETAIPRRGKRQPLWLPRGRWIFSTG